MDTNFKKPLRFIIYKRPKDKNYTGVCLDFDIVEEGKDLQLLKRSLLEAAEGYLEAISKKDLDKNLLNRPAPRQYWKILQELEKYLHLIGRTKPNQLSITDIYTFSINPDKPKRQLV